MPLFVKKKVADTSRTRARVRVKTAGTKLSQEEIAELEAHCRRLKIKPGELIRRLILDELHKSSKAAGADPVLSEIVGVRLLLVNLLQPRAPREALTKTAFETLLDEIKRMKKQIALDIELENGRR